jgi:hypothetical protein
MNKFRVSGIYAMSALFNKSASFVKRLFRANQNWEQIEYFDEKWRIRIACMAKFIEEHTKSVADMGCGKCWLKDILPARIKYIGVDYKRRECTDNIVCDFNVGEFPEITADVVFCSGILEYLENLPAFVQKICRITDQVILSYCSTDYQRNLKVRKSLGWKNHLSNLEIINIFLEKGFLIAGMNLEINGNLILYMKRNADRAII